MASHPTKDDEVKTSSTIFGPGQTPAATVPEPITQDESVVTQQSSIGVPTLKEDTPGPFDDVISGPVRAVTGAVETLTEGISNLIPKPPTPEPISQEEDVTTKTSTITPPKKTEPLPLTVAPTVKGKDLKTAPGGVPTEKPKPLAVTDVDKTIDGILEGQRDNIDLGAMDFIEMMISGEDPIAELAFNWQMQMLGPIFSAANDNLILRLKQQGISGTNAGNAWISSMARRQGVQVSDIVNRINFESAQRIEEWNRYGPERANAIMNNRLNYQIDKYRFGIQQINHLQMLGEVDPQAYINIGAANGVNISPETADFISTAVASGNQLEISAGVRELNSNYTAIEANLEAQVPGLAVDASAFLSLTTIQQDDINSRVTEIKQAIINQDVEAAQTLMQELKEMYPNAIVGNYDEWNPADFRTHEDNVDIQTFKADAKLRLSQGDEEAAIKILLDNVIDPTTVSDNFDNLWATTSPDRQAELIEAAGLDGEPITNDDKALILAHDMLSGMTKTTTQSLFETVYNNAKGVEVDGVSLQEWMMIPENNTIVRAWLFSLSLTPGAINEDGNIVPVAGMLLPPWEADSDDAHYFTDWPMADSFNEETDEVNITYTGNNAYEDDNDFQTSDGYMNYRGQMDLLWEDYKKGGGDLTRREWFDDVKPVWDGSSLILNGEAQDRGDEGETTNFGTVLNPNVAQKENNFANFQDNIIGAGETPTEEDVLNSLTSVNTLPNSGHDSTAFLDDPANPGGWVNWEGMAVQVQPGGITSSNRTNMSVITTIDGATFSAGEDGQFIAGNFALWGNSLSLEGGWRNDSRRLVQNALRLPDNPQNMTPEDLKNWSDYADFVLGPFDSSGKPEKGFSDIVGTAQGMSFEDWMTRDTNTNTNVSVFGIDISQE